MREHALGGPSPPRLTGKAATLDRLHRAGLPVPAGLVVPLGEPLSERSGDLLRELVRGGPVIVRSALAVEDQATASGAGLGTSVHGCTSRAQIDEALETIRADRRALAPRDRGSGPRRDPKREPLGDQAIVQREIAAVLLLVIADAPDLATTVEVYRPGAGALSAGSTPSFAGPLGRWPDSARPATERIIAAARGVLEPSAQGLDLEIVIDRDARPWLVQARPLTRALQPGWGSFAAAVVGEGASLPEGWWRLDTEHNPAPLSAAHGSLLTWLRTRRPGTPRSFAGWLYERVPPPIVAPPPSRPEAGATAEPVRARPDSAAPGVPPELTLNDPYKGLEHLQETAIPAAREQLRAITDALRHADRDACAATIDPALEALLRVIDTYAALAPSRATPRTTPPSRGSDERGPNQEQEHTGHRSRVRDSAPLCLADRSRFLDVLPSAWDIAAPSLSELDAAGDEVADAPEPAGGSDTGPTPRAAVPIPALSDLDDLSAQTWLLRELDDHLFALGLAPMRRVYLRAAHLLGIDPSRIFGLRHAELSDALRDKLSDEAVEELLVRRAEAHRRSLALRPPPHIFNGAPLPIPAYGHLRGLGIGAPCRGRVAQRRDLADLKARPPAEDAILIMPTLTVAAAVVLDALGVRALCSASGGALSHAALIVRELGISALIGCRGATELIDGERIVLDTARGRIERPEAAPRLSTPAHASGREPSSAGR